MKRRISCLLILLMTMLYISANAQEPLVLYDDFNSKFMDVTKWTSGESRGSGVILLETVRETHGGRLHLAARAFGNIGQYQSPPSPVLVLGTRSGDVNAGFGASALGATKPFNTLKVSVKVKKAEATGCPLYNASPTSARARLLGFFFNAGVNPGSTGRTDDVGAQITIQRNSDSLEKSQILEVWFYVFRCTNSDCSIASYDGLQPILLGEIKLGQWATIQIDWDGQFFYGKLNEELPGIIDITQATTPPPDNKKWSPNPVKGGYWNALGASNRLAASCPAEERAMAYIEAEFDNLFVR